MMDNFLILCFSLGFCLSGCHGTTNKDQQETRIAEIRTIDATELKQQLDNSEDDEKLVLVDVRTQAEIDQSGRIPGALWLDFSARDFESKLMELPKDSDLIVYCHAGGRSAKAAKLLHSQGYSSVKDFQGGMVEWQRKNFPTE